MLFTVEIRNKDEMEKKNYELFNSQFPKLNNLLIILLYNFNF